MITTKLLEQLNKLLFYFLFFFFLSMSNDFNRSFFNVSREVCVPEITCAGVGK